MSYVVSSFFVHRENREVINLNLGQWEKKVFEEMVWLPVFRHAKYIKFYDRYIGRSLRYNKELGRFDIAAHFESNLDWILSQILNSSRKSTQMIEFYCGVGKDDDTRKNPLLAAKTLNVWAKNRQNYYGKLYDREIKIYVKHESQECQLRHSRFLITDQVALLFEGGFEILKPDGYVKDTVITLIPNPEEYEKDILRLPDVLAHDIP